MGPNQILFQKEQDLVTFNYGGTHNRSGEGNSEAQGAQVSSLVPLTCRNRTRANVGDREETASLESGSKNSEKQPQ